MTTEIRYSTIKAIDLTSAMNSSDTATKAMYKAKENQGTTWDHTVATIMSTVDCNSASRDTSKEGIEDLRLQLVDIMAAEVKTELGGTIPETGKDRSGKKDIVLARKDGSIKWSSWSRTKVIFGYLGDIAKIIQFGKEDELYPEDNKIGARCDVLALCKTEKTALDNIKRLTGELQDNCDQVSTASDVLESHRLVSSIMVNNLDISIEMNSLLDRFDALLAVADESEKTAIKSKLLKIASTRF